MAIRFPTHARPVRRISMVMATWMADLNCSFSIDAGDIVLLLGSIGQNCDGLGPPNLARSIEDCLEQHPAGSVALQRCIEAVQAAQGTGEPQ